MAEMVLCLSFPDYEQVPLAEEQGVKPLPKVRHDRRRMFRRLNHCYVPDTAPICVDSNDPATVKRAFESRVMRDLPKPIPRELAALRKFVRKFVVKHIPRISPKTFDEWLDGTPYTTQRKEQLRLVHDELRGGPPSRRQCQHIDSFIKTEFYPTLKNGRMINSRSDHFKAYSGRFFKAIEDEVFSLPQFIKHTPVPLRPAKVASLKKHGRRYFITDYTAFESIHPIVMNCVEIELYRHCLGNGPVFRLIRDTLLGKNSMRTRRGLRATLMGRRMSGDMCTSLGNGFTNLMVVSYLVHKKRGFFEGFVEGDDGIFSTDVQLSEEDFAALGFKIKLQEVADPCEASFCGIVCSDNGEIIRDPHKFLQGFGWTHSFISAGPKIMDELLRAKALSTVYETPQCPIVGEMARLALRLTAHVHPRFVNDGYHVCPDVVSVPEFRPSSETRELFSRLYGIPVPVQLSAEEAIRKNDMLSLSHLIPSNDDSFYHSLNYVTP